MSFSVKLTIFRLLKFKLDFCRHSKFIVKMMSNYYEPDDFDMESNVSIKPSVSRGIFIKKSKFSMGFGNVRKNEVKYSCVP